MRSVVDLPQPDGPTRTRNSLSLTSIETSRTAVTSPKRLVTRSRVTLAISCSLLVVAGPGWPPLDVPGEIARGRLSIALLGRVRTVRHAAAPYRSRSARLASASLWGAEGHSVGLVQIAMYRRPL